MKIEVPQSQSLEGQMGKAESVKAELQDDRVYIPGRKAED